jgi:Protein-L-isoaspartate(D-aspartate) O-methyltransferase (PCMT)
MEISVKQRIAQAVVPCLRLPCRYVPILRQPLWNGIISKHFSWRSRMFRVRTHFGATMIGNTKDIIDLRIYWFGIWEPHIDAIITARLNPGDTFIDIGANVGYFSLLASDLVGDSGCVVAIEALSANAERLRRNIAATDAKRVRVVHAAASDSSGPIQMWSGDPDNAGMASSVRHLGGA